MDALLSADIRSEMAVPPHDNAAIDGYAVRFSDLAAGDDDLKSLAASRRANRRPCTGRRRNRPYLHAADADTVLMQEDCREDGYVIIPPGIQGCNRRACRRGHCRRRCHSTRRRLRPPETGDSIGRTELPVARCSIRVALIFNRGRNTRYWGDLPPGCIYDANRYSVAAALDRLGCAVSDLGILPDDYDVIHAGHAVENHDLIVTSGGVSTGEEDHVQAAVDVLGHMHFGGLPARPPANVPFIGLPGNPGCRAGDFHAVRKATILRLGGCRFEPSTGSAPASPSTKSWDVASGCAYGLNPIPTVVYKFPGRCRHTTSMVGLVELPEDLTSLEAGAMVDYLPFNEFRIMQVLYFGWVRSRIGHGKEELKLPGGGRLAGLIHWLKSARF